MLLNYGVGEDSWKSVRLQGDQASQSSRKSILNILWRNWCWSWSSNILATWCKEPTHWKIPWCWERLKAGKEGDNRGWEGWLASPTQWTWVWTSSRRWWGAGKPVVLQSIGAQWVDMTEQLNNNLSRAAYGHPGLPTAVWFASYVQGLPHRKSVTQISEVFVYFADRIVLTNVFVPQKVQEYYI